MSTHGGDSFPGPNSLFGRVHRVSRSLVPSSRWFRSFVPSFRSLVPSSRSLVPYLQIHHKILTQGWAQFISLSHKPYIMTCPVAQCQCGQHCFLCEYLLTAVYISSSSICTKNVHYFSLCVRLRILQIGTHLKFYQIGSILFIIALPIVFSSICVCDQKCTKSVHS